MGFQSSLVEKILAEPKKAAIFHHGSCKLSLAFWMPPFAQRHQRGRTKTDHCGVSQECICSGFNYLTGRHREDRAILLRGNTRKVEYGKFPLDMRKVFHSDADQMLDQGPERLWKMSWRYSEFIQTGS